MMRMCIVIQHNCQRANLSLWFQNGHKSEFASILTKPVLPIDEYFAVDFDISRTHRLISTVPTNTTSQRATRCFRILKQTLPPTSNNYYYNYYASDDINKH